MADETPVSDSVTTGRKVLYFSDFSAALDLVALGGGGECPRRVTVLDADEGTTLEFVDATDTTVSVAGDKVLNHSIDCAIATITDNTDVALIEVIW